MEIRGLLQAVAEWAGADSRVSGLVLVGSHARGTARSDSDVDLVLLSSVPQELLCDASWAASFGGVTSTKHEDYGRLTSIRVQYAEGPEVEFGIADVRWASLPLDPGTRRVLANGARPLYDDAGLLERALGALSEP